MITEENIIQLEDAGERFKYLLKGKYIEDCVKNKAYWNYLARDFLEVDMLSTLEEQQEPEKEVKLPPLSKVLATVEEEKTPKVDSESTNGGKVVDSESPTQEMTQALKTVSQDSSKSNKSLNKLYSHEANINSSRDTFSLLLHNDGLGKKGEHLDDFTGE